MLETIKDTTKINHQEIGRNPYIKNGENIRINEMENIISFRLQKGSAKEAGENGCSVDTLIAAAGLIINGLNDIHPCEENDQATHHLGIALATLKNRQLDREKRGDEGYNEL